MQQRGRVLELMGPIPDCEKLSFRKYDFANLRHTIGFLPCLSQIADWDAGIRTPISRSRVCGPTVGRRPKRSIESTNYQKLPHFVLLPMGEIVETRIPEVRSKFRKPATAALVGGAAAEYIAKSPEGFSSIQFSHQGQTRAVVLREG